MKLVYADLALGGNEEDGKGSLNMFMRAADGKAGEGQSAKFRVMKPATGMKGMMRGLQLPLVLSSACCLSACVRTCVRADTANLVCTGGAASLGYE